MADDGSPVDSRTDGPVVDVDRFAISPDCSREELLAVARIYAREVVDAHGLSVAVDDLEWSVSRRAKRRAGAVKHRDGEPESIVLTWGYFEAFGWAKTAAIVRHELIHVHLLNEADDPGHGPAFCRLADELETGVHCERFAEPKWWVICAACGSRAARYRRSKLVSSPGAYRCSDCGGSLIVERNG